MLQGLGLLRYHRVEPYVSRMLFDFVHFVHSTAVLTDLKTDQKWAVDSWVRNSGEVPDVRPLAESARPENALSRRTKRECHYARELDLKTLVWTHGLGAPMNANRIARFGRSAVECADMAGKTRDPRAKAVLATAANVWRSLAAAKLSKAIQRGRRLG
jgi:hypothetical protein